MIKYCKIIDNETGLCQVGIGTNYEFYKSLGMRELDVTESEIDNQWYLTEKLDTEEYRTKLQTTQKEERIYEIKIELDELDKKRIRAICEPALKDGEAGETWLEYYNKQISDLRKELSELSS